MVFYTYRFKTNLAKEVIQEILIKHLKDKSYKQIDVNILTKNIAKEIQNKLKGVFFFFFLYDTYFI